MTKWFNIIQTVTLLVIYLIFCSFRERQIMQLNLRARRMAKATQIKKNEMNISFGSSSPTLSDRKAFPTFYRTVAPQSSHNTAKLAFIQQFQWDTVSTISEQDAIYSLPIVQMAAKVEDANITVKATLTVTEFDYKAQLKILKEEDARIIIASFSEAMSRKIFCEVYWLGLYGKEYVWILSGGGANKKFWSTSTLTNCSTEQLDKATRGIITAHSHLPSSNETNSTSGFSINELKEEISNLGYNWTDYVAHTYDAAWTIALALRQAQMGWSRELSENNTLEQFSYKRKDMTQKFLEIIEHLCFDGLTGPILFDGPDRLGITEFHQKQDKFVKFALYNPRNRQLDFDCPGCKNINWQGSEVPIARRIIKLRINRINSLALLTVTVLSIIGIIVAIVFLIFNIFFTKLKYIKLSSPKLNNMVVVGCILVYIAVILLGVDNGTFPLEKYFTTLCTTRAYLLSCGFSLAFGSMFTKTYRVHKIFTTSCIGIVKNKMLKDKQLIAMVTVLLVIDCFLVTLWVCVDPMNRRLWNLTIEISKTERNVAYQDQVEQCSSIHLDKWLGVVYIYKGLLLVFGCYMAWETRNVKLQALNDSQYIGLSVYNVVITSAIVVFIANVLSKHVTLTFLLVTTLILISTTTALALLFVPKILAIYRHEHEDPVVAGMGLKIEYKTRRLDMDETKELQYRAKVQNRAYKEELAQLDREIIRLTKLVFEMEKTNPSPSKSTIIKMKPEEYNKVSPNVRSKKSLRNVFQRKKDAHNKFLVSFDFDENLPNYSQENTYNQPQPLTMSLPALDSSVTCAVGHSKPCPALGPTRRKVQEQHSAFILPYNSLIQPISNSSNNTLEYDEGNEVSTQVYYCDDDLDIDNFNVFQEVIIGEPSHSAIALPAAAEKIPGMETSSDI
ncbi:Gamma-aminobutyric acid type B receptor subunit 2 [Nymphon striatum]|nr:Gamma-aminobutyric acid type B receptor subunit 2 [Nymphon striatum]